VNARPKALILTVFVSLFASAASAGEPAKQQPLFHIERSKNANIVRYDVRLDGEGNVDREEPVEAYWVRLASSGERAPLTWIQRKLAYGYKVQDKTRQGFTMRLVAFEERPIRVQSVKGGYRAMTIIGGRLAYLDKIYVRTKEDSMMPKVLYIELFGEDLTTGQPAYEKKLNGS